MESYHKLSGEGEIAPVIMIAPGEIIKLQLLINLSIMDLYLHIVLLN